MWVDPGSVTVKFLTSQKVKILYDSSDPAFNKDVMAAGTLPASGAAAAVVASPVQTGSSDSASQLGCAQEYSALQVPTAVSVPAQRV